ncbi:TonB-linked SusC/RagA family outer membrane protein [Ancylomarina subtilis]|uniref:TonB-linked SusC/RagA family outer membrane protein n=1 Tax=Ancylomarina subtilis TaxID=1639035 RepID=A0A4Q7VJP2_9BACT|nr:SusC/RagA family TonB-linked outer membrane protein [Ancylomarina subtilis]RZT96426.1 TonB-linked SusC/RagA family outer membrane protein [Ancylomarina subtilis]
MMKVFIFLTFALTLSASASIYSQNQRVSFELKEVSVLDVLNEIKMQTGLRFIYSEDKIEELGAINFDASDMRVDEALEEIFKDTKLECQFRDDVIMIVDRKYEAPKEEKQEKKEVKGTVTDADGNTLPGVSVVVKGSTTGVATDIDGNYNIKIESDNAVLVFSFVGMLSQEIVYAGQSIQNVTLLADSEVMNEVVVTGYQTLSRERATGAFEKVSTEVLDRKITMNIVNKLEGQTTGVLFNEQGEMEIRGVSTLYADKTPLIVVDGFPIEGDMETINPNDIESITILKDAAAASIWGARAANGVIVIVSKKADKDMRPVVEFTSSLSLTQKPDLYDLPFASTSSYLEYEEEMVRRSLVNMPNGNYQPVLTEGMETFLNYSEGNITEQERDAILNKLKQRDVRDEFSDLLMRNSISQQYGLSLRGRLNNSSYYASLSYSDNAEFAKANNNERITSYLGVNSKITDRLSIDLGVNVNARKRELNGIQFTDITRIPQYQQILDENGDYINQAYSHNQAYVEKLVLEKNLPYDWNYNLKREFDNKDNVTNNLDLKLRAALNYTLTDYLNIDAKYQYEWGDVKGKNLYNEDTYQVRNLVNTYSLVNDRGMTEQQVPKGAILKESFSNYSAFTSRGQINFDKSFNDDLHQLVAIAGIEMRKVKYESSNYTKHGYDDQSLQYATTPLGVEYSNIFNGSKRKLADDTKYEYKEDRFLSYYFNTSYTYNDKYTFTGSARLDDSNLFGASSDYRNVPLWSVGGNWQMHKEEFFDFDFVDLFTLRATYGWNGNVDKSTSPYLIADVRKDYYTQRPYAKIQNPKNPKLRWERTAVANFGLDFSMLNHRLAGSLEYYTKYSDGVLGQVALNSTYGFSQALMNTAEISNKGIDVNLNSLIVNKEVKWNLGLNFSYNKNKIKKIEMPDNTYYSYIQGYLKEGLPLNYMYSYKWAGLSEEGEPRIYDEKGEILSADQEPTTHEALKYEGSTTPKYYGSIINSISYKGLSLSLLTTFKLGYVFRTNSLSYDDYRMGAYVNWIHKDIDNVWKKPGDELITDLPKLRDGSYPGMYESYAGMSSNTVHSASHIRFKEVILSYNIPEKYIKNLHVSNLNVSAQIRNFGYIAFNSKNIDPENMPDFSGYGIDNKPEFSFSLRATF